MSVVAGQFSDAESDSGDCVVTVSQPFQPTIQTTIPPTQPNGLETKSSNEDEDCPDEYYDDYSDEEDFSDYEDYHVSVGGGTKAGMRNGNLSLGSNAMQPSDKVFLTKFDAKIRVDKLDFAGGGGDRNLSGAQVSAVLDKQRKQDKERLRVKDKADRATIEQVMDPRTRMILFKMLNRGFISEINGCISTGESVFV